MSGVFEGNSAFGLDGMLDVEVAEVCGRLSALEGDPLPQADEEVKAIIASRKDGRALGADSIGNPALKELPPVGMLRLEYFPADWRRAES